MCFQRERPLLKKKEEGKECFPINPPSLTKKRKKKKKTDKNRTKCVNLPSPHVLATAKNIENLLRLLLLCFLCLFARLFGNINRHAGSNKTATFFLILQRQQISLLTQKLRTLHTHAVSLLCLSHLAGTRNEIKSVFVTSDSVYYAKKFVIQCTERVCRSCRIVF